MFSVIGIDDAFQGTLTQTSVYPREIVKRALARNAAAVIFAQIALRSHARRAAVLLTFELDTEEHVRCMTVVASPCDANNMSLASGE